MSWRPKPRNADTDSSYPRAWGTSDRNGFVYNLHKLVPQYEWAGPNLVQVGNILVGEDERDVPQEQFRMIVIPPDPPPILNARPEQYSIDEGLMPLTTEGAFTGDPGSVIRDETGNYIGQDVSE